MYDVIQCERLTENVSQILLSPPENNSLVYQAGQYINAVHQNGVLSPLSIACAPNQTGVLELHLAHPPGNALAEDLLNLIHVEKKLQLTGPFGTCTAKKIIQQQPVIFLARGTGFAPIKAMLEEAQMQQNKPSLHLFWSVTKQEDFYLRAQVEAWVREMENFSFTPVLTQTDLLQHAVLHHYPDLANYRVYASAGTTLVYEIWDALSQHGLKKESYFSDVFT